MLPHLKVFAFLIEQLLVRALFKDVAVIQYNNSVHIQNGRKTVGDD